MFGVIFEKPHPRPYYSNVHAVQSLIFFYILRNVDGTSKSQDFFSSSEMPYLIWPSDCHALSDSTTRLLVHQVL